METCKIRIEKKTNFRGMTYYYLYVNDQYIDLYTGIDKAMENAQIAEDVFTSGTHIATEVYSKELTR
jgi:hypothetical protein